MRIIIAGAGAGKTTSMAKSVLERYRDLEEDKIIYVITYTNAARDRIREKIIEENGIIPMQIKVETYHVFLLQEIIFPFHHLLYEQQYTSVSLINLPNEFTFRAKKISELKVNKIIHVDDVTEVARYVLLGKSNDKKIVKERREKILSIIGKYLDYVFLDEAQDMDKDLSKIIEVLDIRGIGLYLVGDPKQDLRGHNQLRKLIEEYKQYVEYRKENHRCPMSHVNLSNIYVSEEEKQEHQIEEIGEFGYIYESDINITEYINNGMWCYCYIYNKNKRFNTKLDNLNSAKSTLSYELKRIVQKSDMKKEIIDQVVYILKKHILEDIHTREHRIIINDLEKTLKITLDKQDKAKLYNALKNNMENMNCEGILVTSIDKIKGLEGKNCLFILTTDLSDYFFMEKTEQNKMLNYLYVALTRAKRKLMILVTVEVENKYGREWINGKINNLLELISE